MVDQAFNLRAGDAGPEVTGTPGNVLTFQPDGRVRGEPPGGGGGPLSAVFWVDQNTTAPLASQDGSAGAPFGTMLAAVTARAGLGGTILVVPADYSAEVLPPLTGLAWSFVGADFGSFEVTSGAFVAPAGPITRLPNLDCDPSSSLWLRSVRLQNLSNANGAFLTDVNITNALSATPGSFSAFVRASRSYFGGGGVGEYSFFDADQCGFFGSQTIQIVNSLGAVRLTNCYGETGFVFGGFSPGTALVDLYTRDRLTIPVLTNCALQLLGFGPPSALPSSVSITPSLTASLASPQAQIDDIVSAGVQLGLWVDNRVP